MNKPPINWCRNSSTVSYAHVVFDLSSLWPRFSAELGAGKNPSQVGLLQGRSEDGEVWTGLRCEEGGA